MQEVLASLKVAINAQTWTLRKHAALALASLATERRIGSSSALELMGVCTDAMAGRPWSGKEALYDAAAALSPVAFVAGDSLEQSAPHTALVNAYAVLSTTAAAVVSISRLGKKKTGYGKSLNGATRSFAQQRLLP